MTAEIIKSLAVTYDPRVPMFEADFPLTEAQREIWVSAVLNEDANRAFNLSSHLRISGSLDPERLKDAAFKMVSRHSALSSHFAADGETFRILADQKPEWQYFDRTDLSNSIDDSDEQIIRDVSDRPFDMANGPFIRVALIKSTCDKFQLVVVVHHIVCDGWSVRAMLKDLSLQYNQKDISESALNVDTMPDCYTQYALRNEMLNGTKEKRAAAEYWANELQNLDEPSRLPPNMPRPPTRSYNADCIFTWLDDDLSTSVIDFARRQNMSLFAVLLAGFSVWVSKISGNTDVVAGVPVAGQPFFGMEECVGHCANLLPFRCQVDPNENFESVLQDIQNSVADGYTHQIATFGEILQSLQIKRDASLIPLVPITLNIVSASDTLEFADCEVERLSTSKKYGTFELALDVYRDGNRLELEAIFNRDLFSREMMSEWLASFRTMLAMLVQSPETEIRKLGFLDDEKYRSLVRSATKESPEFDLTVPITAVIDSIATLGGTKTAIAAANGSLSYQGLRILSDQYGAYLRSLGACRGEIIGVYVERSEILPALLLGVMKSGAAYLPIDPSFPDKRRDYMLQDSGARIVITQASLRSNLPANLEQVLIDDQGAAIDESSSEDKAAHPLAEDRAYVIYTSGSTGNPKGVELSHRNLMNFLMAMRKRPGLSSNDRMLALTSLSFDISILELFLPLVTGAAVYVGSADDAGDGGAIAQLIDDYSLNVVQGTPSMWRLMLESGWQGQDKLKALCGGEPMPPELVPDLLALGCELWNMYGPTETTVWSTCAKIDSVTAPLPIGTPVHNNEVYILDSNLNIVPPGVSGEICIGGNGVAIGYLDRPELTSDRFVEVAFPGNRNSRMYRTGDLGVTDVDGVFYHQGRMDFQVKLRGYRIELGEIESRLVERDDIEQSVVDVWAADGMEPVLVAYIRKRHDCAEPSTKEMRAFLQDVLPTYMIPQRFEWRDEFPLTPNGKVDRKRLSPSAEGSVESESGSTHLNVVESGIASIWLAAIGGQRPRKTDNFFDIGGHSLLAVRVLQEIKTSFDVSIPTHLIALEDLSVISKYVEDHGTLPSASFGEIIKNFFRGSGSSQIRN